MKVEIRRNIFLIVPEFVNFDFRELNKTNYKLIHFLIQWIKILIQFHLNWIISYISLRIQMSC